MESHHAIKTGKLYSLSEEQILDCSHNRDHSCGGGMPAYAFQYLAGEGGQELESAYRTQVVVVVGRLRRASLTKAKQLRTT